MPTPTSFCFGLICFFTAHFFYFRPCSLSSLSFLCPLPALSPSFCMLPIHPPPPPPHCSLPCLPRCSALLILLTVPFFPTFWVPSFYSFSFLQMEHLGYHSLPCIETSNLFWALRNHFFCFSLYCLTTMLYATNYESSSRPCHESYLPELPLMPSVSLHSLSWSHTVPLHSHP